jgi:hypothetical protein
VEKKENINIGLGLLLVRRRNFVTVKVKQSRYRLGVAQRVPGS